MSDQAVLLKPTRRHDLDALRVLATLLLIVFHSGRAFTTFEPWHIENLERSRAVGWMLSFISYWHMPLFFLLAGASAWYAFGSRTRRAFIGERARRLLVPLAFGMLVIIPPQVYIERIATWCPFRQSPTDFSGSFWAWYPHTFQCCYEDGNLSWHHLWFLMYLFVYSAALAPLFWWLRRAGGRAVLDRVTGFLARGWWVLVPAVGVAAAEVALRSTFPNNQNLVEDFANHANYAFVFVMGFVLVGDPRVAAAVRRVWPGALAVGSLGALTPMILSAAGASPLPYAPNRLLAGMAEWFILVGLLGLAQAFLDRPIRWIRRFAVISLPFYIWHQTVIVVLAYWVVQWNASITTKYAALAGMALVITWALAEAVRLTPVTRVAFGLPWHEKKR